MHSLTRRGLMALLVFAFLLAFGFLVLVVSVGMDTGASPSTQSGALTPEQRYEVEVLVWENCVDMYEVLWDGQGFRDHATLCGRRP